MLIFTSICPSHTEKEGGQSGWMQLLNNFHQESRLLLFYSNLSLWLCLDCKMAAGLPDIASKFQAGRRGKSQRKAFQEVPLAEFQDWDMWLHSPSEKECFQPVIWGPEQNQAKKEGKTHPGQTGQGCLSKTQNLIVPLLHIKSPRASPSPWGWIWLLFHVVHT